jgi:hypothetical protein
MDGWMDGWMGGWMDGRRQAGRQAGRQILYAYFEVTFWFISKGFNHHQLFT